jgi:outer membrane protein OmpA-like peptidoglycan-associated protein
MPRPAVIAAAVAVESIRFDAGSDALSAEASERLADFAEALRRQSADAVLVRAERGADEALARRRAQAVRHALEAGGAEPARIVIEPLRPGGTGVVELQLR